MTRRKDWVKGRVALLATPPAPSCRPRASGASMALEAAAVLDDELGRTDARFRPGVLARYEMRRTGRNA